MGQTTTTGSIDLRAPFPWFGGKRRVGELCWERFGDVKNYVEPFFGSGAVLLQRPRPFRGKETINDRDGFVANFWRGLQQNATAVTRWASWPTNENDLHARHAWLVEQTDGLVSRLEGDPTYCDYRIAGYWVWGLACWIGSGWCSGKGPWHSEDGKLIHLGDNGRAVQRQLIHLGDNGRGVQRQRIQLGDNGRGVQRQNVGDTCNATRRSRQDALRRYMHGLADRMHRVSVCCGDWSRVTTKTPTYYHGLTAVFLDPPYLENGRVTDIYSTDSLTVAHECEAWAAENGNNPLLRIALCGYEGDHNTLQDDHGWQAVAWKGPRGMAGNGNTNRTRERIWFSPHCLPS